MMKLPFYIGNFLACFVFGARARSNARGNINNFFYRPVVARFVKKIFNEQAHTVKFVRQHTPSRFVCVVNDKYFVKIFKKMSHKKLENFEFLVNYVRSNISVNVPKVYIGKPGNIYAAEKIEGKGIYDFDGKFVLQHEQKILRQVEQIISSLQNINLKKIPNPERFCVPLEATSKKFEAESITDSSVLAHCDLNIRNFLFDDDMNILGLIDFDSFTITNDKNKDMQIFMKYWERYKRKTARGVSHC